MKKIIAITAGVCLLFLSTESYSQSLPTPKPSVIEPFPLAITDTKTTTLVFPFAIKSVDRGSQQLLAQQAKGVANVLQIKATRKDMEETNLTVITADGTLYAYLIRYTPHPPVLTLHYPDSGHRTAAVFFAPATANEADMKAVVKKIAGMKRMRSGTKDKHAGISLRLEGLYVHKDVVYYRIQMQNRTFLEYTLEQCRFFIRDRQQSKRTAWQEQEITPLFIPNDTTVIKGQSGRQMVFALPKHTLPDQKYLAMEVTEKNGGRHLGLRIKNRTMIRAIPIAP